MSTNTKVGLGLGLVTLLVAGCATHGRPIDQAQVQTLKPGISTMQEVTAKLGPPSYTAQNPYGGGWMMIWSYAKYQVRPEQMIPIVGSFVGGAHVESSVVTVKFNADGVME